MTSIIVTRPVVIKVRVTENYKRGLLQQIEYSLRRLEVELQRLERGTGTGAAGPGQPDSRVDSPLEMERRKRLEAQQKLAEQARGVRSLQPGDEVVQGRVESLVRLRVGDDWQSLMGVEVILEDGRVVEIRSQSGGTHSG